MYRILYSKLVRNKKSYTSFYPNIEINMVERNGHDVAFEVIYEYENAIKRKIL